MRGERSKTGQSRLTRWIDRLIPVHFVIKHLARNKMGLLDQMSWNSVGLAIPPSECDEVFVAASINAFINNLEMIDYVILKTLANRNLAPYQLIQKRAEDKRQIYSTSNSQLKEQQSGSSRIGLLQKLKQNQFCSNQSKTQSALSLRI